MKKNQFKIYLTLSLLLGTMFAQAQFKTQIKTPRNRHTPTKIVEADVPKVSTAAYISARKEAIVVLAGGGGTAYRFNAATNQFRQLNTLNNVTSVRALVANSGNSAVFIARKRQNDYCYNPINGRMFMLPKMTGVQSSVSMFNGSNLLGIGYLKKGSQTVYESGLLLYMNALKGSKWQSLLLHSALNKAVPNSKFRAINPGGTPKASRVQAMAKAGNGYIIAFTYAGAKHLLAWIRLSKTGNRMKIAQVKIIGNTAPGTIKIREYRGSTYVTDRNRTYVYDRNGNQKKIYQGKTFINLIREKKVPTGNKYVTVNGKVIYDMAKNRVDNGHTYFMNGKFFTFSVRERSYGSNQRGKVKPYWFLKADRK